MKRDLEKIISDEKEETKTNTELTTDDDGERRASTRGQSSSRVYATICMFCEKIDKHKEDRRPERT